MEINGVKMKHNGVRKDIKARWDGGSGQGDRQMADGRKGIRRGRGGRKTEEGR